SPGAARRSARTRPRTAGRRRPGSASSSSQHSGCRLGGRREDAAHRSELGRVGLAGPLVHVEFLELEGDRAAMARIAVMDEAGELALALEGDILADVEPAAVEVEAAHFLH